MPRYKPKFKEREKKNRENLQRLKILIPNEDRRDDGWGTIKPDKTEMEEARMIVCPECGCSAGRHLSICGKG